MENRSEMSRRCALAGGIGAIFGSALLAEDAAAQDPAASDTQPTRRPRRPREEREREEVWKYVQLDPARVAQAAYDAYDPNGCMYGAVKGALSVYADTIESESPAQAQLAREFPCLALRCGKTGMGAMESLCGTVNGACLFMGLFVPDLAELHVLIRACGEYYRETPMPQFVPLEDKHPDFRQSVSHSLLCSDNKGVWLALDPSDAHRKLRSERCKRTTATLIAHTVELLNRYFTVGLEGMGLA